MNSEMITKESALKAISLRMCGSDCPCYSCGVMRGIQAIIQSLPPVALSICADCNSTIYSNRPIEGVHPVADERLDNAMDLLERAAKIWHLTSNHKECFCQSCLEEGEWHNDYEALLSELNQQGKPVARRHCFEEGEDRKSVCLLSRDHEGPHEFTASEHFNLKLESAPSELNQGKV